MFEVAATIFRPTSPTNQNQPKVKISDFRVFWPIWMKFGMGAINGPTITWYKFEMATANLYASSETPHIPSRTIILFRFFSLCSSIMSSLHELYSVLLEASSAGDDQPLSRFEYIWDLHLSQKTRVFGYHSLHLGGRRPE